MSQEINAVMNEYLPLRDVVFGRMLFGSGRSAVVPLIHQQGLLKKH